LFRGSIITVILTLYESSKKKLSQKTQVFLVAGEPQISIFLEGYELVVDLWKYMNRRDD
jgi:hypothetical protein